MTRAIAFALALAAGVQAWRNFPADGPVSMDSAVFVSLVGIVCAYLAGRWDARGRGSATAVAVASAEATAVAAVESSNTVNVAVVMPGAGAGSSSRLPEVLPWQESRPALTADQLDGMDLSDLLEDSEEEPIPDR